jgi:hypothetical protein
MAGPDVFTFGDTRYVWQAAQPRADLLREWLATAMTGPMAKLKTGSGKLAPGLRNRCDEWHREARDSVLIRINLHERGVSPDRSISPPRRPVAEKDADTRR